MKSLTSQSQFVPDSWVQTRGELPSGFIKLVIVDNGNGISKQYQDEIFSRPTSTKGRPGIGLLLTNEVLALAGAKLEYNTSEAGTTFSILIPMTKGLKNL